MKRKRFHILCAVILAVSMCIFVTGCGERDVTAQGAEDTASPEPVTTPSATDVQSGETTSLPSDTPEATPEPTPTATPEPATVTGLQYEGQTVTELSFMTTSVFQLQALTSDGSSGGTWTSSDASSASVDENGVVTCWKVGTPKITYTLGESSASCTLTITEPTVQILFGGAVKTDISLSSLWGYEIQLVSQVDPAGSEVSWSSSNEDVASVSETGYVTAHMMGNATITCKCGTAMATCIIRVVDNPPSYMAATPAPDDDTPRILITYAGAPNPDFTMTVGMSLDMDYQLYNIDPSTPVTWSVEDPSYLSVDANGVIVALKSTWGIDPTRNYTKLIVKCGDYTYESAVFIKEK